MEKLIKEIIKNAEIKKYFDESLKGKHFKNKVTDQVLEATGYVAERANLKSIQVIDLYTQNHQAIATYLLEDNLEQTNQPLTILPNMKK